MRQNWMYYEKSKESITNKSKTKENKLNHEQKKMRHYKPRIRQNRQIDHETPKKALQEIYLR